MKRLLPLVVLAVLLIPLRVQAHNFNGTGDCEGWTLTLDGLYGAHHLYIDGVDSPLQLGHTFPDASSTTSRSFVVFWDKASGDVTVTHTLYRQGECTPVTTTTAQVTTTTAEVTTTTQTTTTTPNETTTTQPPVEVSTTTIPIPQCPPGTVHQPPLCVTTTIPHFDTTTTAPPVTTETLPVTGMSAEAMVGLGVSLAALGGLVLLGTRNRKAEG